eukprot:gene20605-22638_t
MADSENTSQAKEKKKRGSKKTKKGWRKATNVADVEEHLEEIRREERTGGIISEKEDSELFFEEKKLSSEEVKNAVIDRKPKTIARTAVDESSDEEEHVSRKDLMKKKRKQEAEQELKQKAKIQKVSHDAWGMNKPEPKNIWLQDTFKKPLRKPTSVGEKQSLLPAVEVCDTGASYNPDYDSHQDLLRKALEEEIRIADEQQKLNQKIKFLSQEEYKQNPSWVEEMSEGLVAKQPDGEKPEQTTEPVDDGIILPKTILSTDRKSKKQRRKEKEMSEGERVKENEKLTKVRMNDVYRLRTLKKELKKDEINKELRRIAKGEAKNKKLNQPKRLGKQKYENPKPVFQLSEDLTGSLRELKPEGDPLLERMKSFEKRNILEPRKRVLPHRKYKLKEVDKRSYKKPTVKDFTSKT